SRRADGLALRLDISHLVRKHRQVTCRPTWESPLRNAHGPPPLSSSTSMPRPTRSSHHFVLPAPVCSLERGLEIGLFTRALSRDRIVVRAAHACSGRYTTSACSGSRVVRPKTAGRLTLFVVLRRRLPACQHAFATAPCCTGSRAHATCCEAVSPSSLSPTIRPRHQNRPLRAARRFSLSAVNQKK